MIRLADCASRVVAISARQETGRIIAGPGLLLTAGDPPCGLAAPLDIRGAMPRASSGRITCGGRSPAVGEVRSLQVLRSMQWPV